MGCYSVTVSYVEIAWGVEQVAGYYATAPEALEGALNAARSNEEREDLDVSISFGHQRIWTFSPREDAEGDCITRSAEWASHLNPIRRAA